MICKHLIKLKGEVNAEFFCKIQRNHSYPFIQENMHEIFYETGFAIEITENNTNLTEEGWNDCIIIYDKLIDITTKALEFLKVNKEAKNPR